MTPFFKELFSKRNGTVVGLCAGSVAVVLVVGVLFGAVSYRTPITIVLFVSAYAAVTAVSVFIVLFFLTLFGKRNWVEERLFITSFFCISLISIGNSLLSYWIAGTAISRLPSDITFTDVWRLFTLFTFTVGILPVSLLYFWIKSRDLILRLQQQKEESRKLISHIQTQTTHIPDCKIITLYGSSKDSLTVLPQEIVMIESLGNYVQVSYTVNGKISQKTLRATLAEMEKALSNYPFLVRCHRAFIVNVYRIEKINTSKLRLKAIGMDIPISKNRRIVLQRQSDLIGG